MKTALCDLFGIRVPIVNAPMTPQAGGALARAVSEAGAFGMLGFDEDENEAQIAEQIEILQQAPAVPFGIGLVAWVLERRPQLLDIALAAKPNLISISFGDPAPYARRVHAAGIRLCSQVQSRAWAQIALDAGVDMLVAQGTEAGGHAGSAVGTLPLLQIVLEMTEKPVLAAGGIATGRGLAAVVAAGASGAWIGTPFLLAQEARNTENARERLRAGDETQTIYTRVYDRVTGKAWPHEFGARALRTPFLERWTGNEDALMTDERARSQFDPKEKLYAGQSVGLLREVKPASQIVREIASQAQSRLDEILRRDRCIQSRRLRVMWSNYGNLDVRSPVSHASSRPLGLRPAGSRHRRPHGRRRPSGRSGTRPHPRHPPHALTLARPPGRCYTSRLCPAPDKAYIKKNECPRSFRRDVSFFFACPRHSAPTFIYLAEREIDNGENDGS